MDYEMRVIIIGAILGIYKIETDKLAVAVSFLERLAERDEETLLTCQAMVEELRKLPTTTWAN